MNFLFLLGDHLRHDAMGWSGNPLARTPNMDALAAESVRFRHCFNQSPVCSPARHSINTGQYVHCHGVWNNTLIPFEGMTTLAHAMNPAGYRCSHRGHMHWKGAQPNGYLPESRGASWVFDREFVDTLPDAMRERAQQEGAPTIRRTTGGPSPRQREHYRGHYVMGRCIADIDQARAEGKPFVAFAAFSEPHPPFYPPADLYRSIDQSRINLPLQPGPDSGIHPFMRQRTQEWAHLTEIEIRQMIAGYHGMVALLDEYMGGIIAHVKAVGEWDNTVVVFGADHGDQLFEHGMFLKFVMRESSVHVPLMIRVPGMEAGNRQALVEHVDLFPTICELAGVEIPASVQGHSLVPLLRASKPPGEWRDTVFSEIKGDDGGVHQIMTRTDRFKLVYYDGVPGELFDLQEDPAELNNRIEDPSLADVVDDLTARMTAWRTRTSADEKARY